MAASIPIHAAGTATLPRQLVIVSSETQNRKVVDRDAVYPVLVEGHHVGITDHHRTVSLPADGCLLAAFIANHDSINTSETTLRDRLTRQLIELMQQPRRFPPYHLPVDTLWVTCDGELKVMSVPLTEMTQVNKAVEKYLTPLANPPFGIHAYQTAMFALALLYPHEFAATFLVEAATDETFSQNGVKWFLQHTLLDAARGGAACRQHDLRSLRGIILPLESH